ncbi:MAG: pantoate--beta-alanine ligase [Myxococcota bacterium]
MKHVSSAEEFRRWSARAKGNGESIALVPTMGYLHEGHLSLLRLARTHGDRVAASIFVNPTQFGPGEDLDRYPRDLSGDFEKLAASGCEIVFTPHPEDVYPDGFSTYVVPEGLGDGLCGASRPGHFRGVATVVAILLRISLADVLVLGEKDYQQLQIIKRMIRDLWLDVRVIPGPIVRESDGLAMSSRNAYLSPSERQLALAIPRALDRVATQFARGDRSVPSLVRTARGTAEEVAVELEYVEIVDAESLQPQSVIQRDAVIAVAARVGSTRLIDNRLLSIR